MAIEAVRERWWKGAHQLVRTGPDPVKHWPGWACQAESAVYHVRTAKRPELEDKEVETLPHGHRAERWPSAVKKPERHWRAALEGRGDRAGVTPGRTEDREPPNRPQTVTPPSEPGSRSIVPLLKSHLFVYLQTNTTGPTQQKWQAGGRGGWDCSEATNRGCC